LIRNTLINSHFRRATAPLAARWRVI
jgi:hypothetical protein